MNGYTTPTSTSAKYLMNLEASYNLLVDIRKLLISAFELTFQE